MKGKREGSVFIVMMLRVASVMIMLCAGSVAMSAEDTATGLMLPRFQTLKTELAGEFMQMPVIRLNSDDRILVTFDEIGDERSYLHYSITHCNSDWQPSGLVESEYVGGFNKVYIEDYAYSANTFIHYVNYLIEIPNDQMRPLVSGNYLLRVYDSDNDDSLVAQVRFRVVEPLAGVSASTTTRTDRGVNGEWQQLSVAVSGEGYDLGNPYQDIKVEVMQNGRQETSRFLKSPLRVDGNTLIYDHSPELLFRSGNEYRRFEDISTGFPGMHVDSMRYMGSNYHAFINEDIPRSDRNYEYDRTQHGRFMVKEYNSTDSNIGSDYVTVHFFLNSAEYPDLDLYVDGEMTHGKFDDRNRMRYDGKRGGYTLALPLKQGAYNYQYVARRKGDNGATSPSLIEGDKYETENEYNIFIYHRPPGARYDRLIGTATVYSN